VRCFIVKMLYTKKKYNTYCLDVVTSISVMIRMIKTTLFFFLTLEDGTARLSRDRGKELAPYAA
jgi:hypothetical protein